MPQPTHPSAPANTSPLLDDWSSLSPMALPTLAPGADANQRSVWSHLVSILIPRLQSARTV